MSHKFSDLLKWLNLPVMKEDFDVLGLCLDSRKIKQGDIFIALSGEDNHGMDFAYQAQRGGAKAILTEIIKTDGAKPKSRQQELEIPVIQVESLSSKLGGLSSRFYGNSSENLEIVGITGTNGKTSSAWLLLQFWNALGIKCGYIGTLGYGTLSQMFSLSNTTPSALELQKILADFVSQGITHVSLEVSSHGICLGRINDIKFNSVAITNISRDHLDFHKTMQEYSNVKKRLFTDFESKYAILNKNEPLIAQWPLDIDSEIGYYCIDNDCKGLSASEVSLLPAGMQFKIIWQGNDYKVQTPLLGHFNIENILLAMSVLLKQGFCINDLLKFVPQLKPVPGRMNCIDVSASEGRQPLVIVDYAHTPDALEQVLRALKQHNARKIWCVFGCGGNRDKGKRPQMGHIAEKYADVVIVTDDNPRYENPEQITNEILMGMETSPLVLHSRQQAIEYAVKNADRRDLILIAGKGHENYQIVNGTKYGFDDGIIAKEVLVEQLGKCA